MSGVLTCVMSCLLIGWPEATGGSPRAHREVLPILGARHWVSVGSAVELLEREGDRKDLEAAIEASRTSGRVVVVLGAVTGALTRHRVLWGACDPLVTPRPLGPLHDVARETGGPLAAAIDAAGSREAVLDAALGELAARDPTTLVVEDLHWADDATLDLVALLGRRLVRSRGCLVITCRTDALRERPEVRRVLGSLPRECVHRIEPQALTPDAVEELARRAGRDAADLH